MSWHFSEYTSGRYTFKDFLKLLLQWFIATVVCIVVIALIAILGIYDFLKENTIPLACLGIFIGFPIYGVRQEKIEAAKALDNRIIGYAEALYTMGRESGVRFGYTINELTDWTKSFLVSVREEAKKSRRGYQFTYEKETGEVWTFYYRDWEHMSFAAGCLLHCAYSKYLKTVDIEKWLEESILHAIRMQENQ